MRIGKITLAATLGVIALFSASKAQAGFTTFTDRAAFLAALPPGYFEDTFSDFTSTQYIGSSVTRTGGPYSVTYADSGPGVYSVPGGVQADSSGNDFIATMNGGNVFAAGGNFFLTDGLGTFQPFPGNSISVFASNGVDPDSTLSVPFNSQTTFFGWISDSPITSITMTADGNVGASTYATMDNMIVSAGPASSAPEPGSLVLLALGSLSGAGFVRSRRK